MNEQKLHDKIENSINFMTEGEQKLVLAMIFYVSEHPEILTDATREMLEALESSIPESTSG